MDKLKVKIKDSNFSHDFSMSVGKKPISFDWVRNNDPVDEWTFVTDNYLNEKNFGGIAMLVEPPSINPHCYSFIKENHKKFKYVLTYLKDFYSLGDNFLFYPFVTSRVQRRDFNLYKKTKLCSIILSNKRMTNNQVFRHKCKELASKFEFVDIFIPEGNDASFYIDKLEATKDYCFSILVENGIYETYITEKLGDSLVCGTVPIYNGAPDVGKFFDSNGILEFNNLEQLENILNKISFEMYNKMKHSIEKNYREVVNYISPEDWIFKNYRQTLFENQPR